MSDLILNPNLSLLMVSPLSYKVRHEYWVAGNGYPQLLFTGEDQFCASLRVEKQSTNMTSQYQSLAFAWLHGSAVVT